MTKTVNKVAALFCKDYQNWKVECRPLDNNGIYSYRRYGNNLSKKQAAWLLNAAGDEVKSHQWSGICDVDGDKLAVNVLFHRNGTAYIHVYSMSEYESVQAKLRLSESQAKERFAELMELINKS